MSPLNATTSRRRPLRRDLLALMVSLALYLLLAYGVVPAWWRHHTRKPGLESSPKITHTSSGIPGDPVNLALIGTKTQLIAAMLAAGWHPADPITLRSSLHIAESSVLRRPYPDAPVSNLYLFGRRQDLAFEQSVGDSPRRRHHVRFWLDAQNGSPDQPLWLGAATFDTSVGLSHRTGQITHHIAPEVDKERDHVLNSLRHAGWLTDEYRVLGRGPTQNGRNGGGDRYVTDGFLDVGELALSTS
jgi:hypothetical protein